MKLIIIILALAVLALLGDLPIAGLGLVLVAAVLGIGDLVQALPDSACTHDCQQGDACTCQVDHRDRRP